MKKTFRLRKQELISNLELYSERIIFEHNGGRHGSSAISPGQFEAPNAPTAMERAADYGG